MFISNVKNSLFAVELLLPVTKSLPVGSGWLLKTTAAFCGAVVGFLTDWNVSNNIQDLQ